MAWSTWAATLAGMVWLYCYQIGPLTQDFRLTPVSFISKSPSSANAYEDTSPSQVFELARSLFNRGSHRDAVQLYEHYLTLKDKADEQAIAATMFDLARAHLALDDMAAARAWTDRYYAEAGTDDAKRVEPAYHLCRGLRERGQNALAYFYYLHAKSLPILSVATAANPYIPLEPDIYRYLLDYEKSILWSYVGEIGERHSKLHGLTFSIQLLENSELPQYLRESVFSNLQYYTPPLPGAMSVLRPEQSIDDEWRYSTPTFLDDETTLIRVVNYYVAEDGSYHVSPNAGNQVNTKLVRADSDEAFQVQLSPEIQAHAETNGLLHPDAYILGLEDTRVVRDYSKNDTIFTLSASAQYSEDGRTMNQVLSVLDLTEMTHTIHGVIKGPYGNRHDKNWVFAGGLDKVVYGWHPSIEIGAIDQAKGEFGIHTTIPSPLSFDGMRGSTNGVLYEGEWWFVTHAVIYRPGQRRKYLHRLVVLDGDLTTILRHSLPFTFEENSDVEYCLGLSVNAMGLRFGYSVRDRSSRILAVAWRDVGEFF